MMGEKSEKESVHALPFCDSVSCWWCFCLFVSFLKCVGKLCQIACKFDPHILWLVKEQLGSLGLIINEIE